MAKVALVSCTDYKKETVQKAVDKGFAYFGGIAALFPDRQSILLKPNLLSGVDPQKAVTTHPNIFRAVGQALASHGTRVGYGDSPGYGDPAQVAEKAGLALVAREAGIELADFVSGQEVDFSGGSQHKKFYLARGIYDYDILVSLPKWKTHGLTRITGAVKNQFGCIPGLLKTELHFKMPDVEQLSRFIVDLNRLLNPRFFIMDAVIAMEGEGPRSGDPRFMGVIGFSDDPVALDSVFCRLINLKPELVPTCRWGDSLGLGEMDQTRIDLDGDDIEQFILPDFRVKRGPLAGYQHKKLVRGLRRYVLSRPRIDRKRCRHCGVCVTVCPAQPKGLDITDPTKLPAFNERSCIRCFCCQEMCPYRAINIYSPPLRWLIPVR